MAKVQGRETELTITPEAQAVLSAMQDRVRIIGCEYGFNSEQYRKVLESYTAALLSVLRLGGRISADGPLSLFGSSFIAYGVVWHAQVLPGNERHPLLGEWGTHS